MLGLSVLTAGTLAAGATGTLAWFTTNKTTSATYNNIKVQGTQGNLKATIAGNTDENANDGPATNAIANKEANASSSFTSDVSSKDGLKFLQPDWKGASGNTGTEAFYNLKNVTKDTGYFTQYLVTVKNTSDDGEAETGSQAKLNITLTGVTITSDNNHADLADWTRVAINTNVEKAEDGKYLALKKTGTDNTYLFQNPTTDISKQYVNDEKAGFTGKAGTMSDVLDTCTPYETSNVNIADTSWQNVVPGQAITIGVSVWMEGMMAVQDTAKGGSISVALTFSSTNA